MEDALAAMQKMDTASLMAEAYAQKAEALKDPKVESVEVGVMGDRVVLRVEEKVNPELQTGESALLGGAMEIRTVYVDLSEMPCRGNSCYDRS